MQVLNSPRRLAGIRQVREAQFSDGKLLVLDGFRQQRDFNVSVENTTLAVVWPISDGKSMISIKREWQHTDGICHGPSPHIWSKQRWLALAVPRQAAKNGRVL